MKNFFSVFDRKKFMFIFRLIVILAVFTISVNMINLAYSRFETNALSSAEAKVAFFVVKAGRQENTITLSGLVPSDTPYVYNFQVSNYNLSGRTNVNLNYTVKFTTTTNMPLNYKVLRNQDYSATATNIITSDNLYQDANLVYYHDYLDSTVYNFGYTANQTDNYVLVVTFPSQYKNAPDDYQGLIDLFTITINAEQKTS
jgi:hypothetical protein